MVYFTICQLLIRGPGIRVPSSAPKEILVARPFFTVSNEDLFVFRPLLGREFSLFFHCSLFVGACILAPIRPKTAVVLPSLAKFLKKSSILGPDLPSNR
jgi:hypothetical protein